MAALSFSPELLIDDTRSGKWLQPATRLATSAHVPRSKPRIDPQLTINQALGIKIRARALIPACFAYYTTPTLLFGWHRAHPATPLRTAGAQLTCLGHVTASGQWGPRPLPELSRSRPQSGTGLGAARVRDAPVAELPFVNGVQLCSLKTIGVFSDTDLNHWSTTVSSRYNSTTQRPWLKLGEDLDNVSALGAARQYLGIYLFILYIQRRPHNNSGY